jgi:hypothetical protein
VRRPVREGPALEEFFVWRGDPGGGHHHDDPGGAARPDPDTGALPRPRPQAGVTPTDIGQALPPGRTGTTRRLATATSHHRTL